MDVLGLLFPKRCVGCRTFGAYLCPGCFARIEFATGSVCAACGRAAINSKTHPVCRGRYSIDGVFASVVYASIVKRLVYQFKFKPYVADLQKSMTELFYEGLIQNEAFSRLKKHGVFLVPIPLHKKKERRRGYNHANLLARQLSSSFSLPVLPLLMRCKETHPHAGLTKEQRKANIKDAFAVQPQHQDKIRDKTIFLVDDIVTSGATMQEAAKVLKKAGAKEVWGLAFAHGE